MLPVAISSWLKGPLRSILHPENRELTRSRNGLGSVESTASIDFTAEERPRRVLVLANVSCNERSCYDDFAKNALPLMHLAGLQVDIIKVQTTAFYLLCFPDFLCRCSFRPQNF